MIFVARTLSAAQTPIATPITTVIAVATSTCDAVSIAVAHSPITPIAPSRTNAHTAERSPLSTNAITVRPRSVTGHGVSTKKLRSGSSPCWTMKFPIGSVMWKTNVVGFWT